MRRFGGQSRWAKTCKGVCLERRIEHRDLRWFGFPLLRGALSSGALQDGESCLERFLRFPNGDAHERSFFRILKRIRGLKKKPWLLLHQLAKLVHTLNQQPFLFRVRIMNRIEDKHGLIVSSLVSGFPACTPSPPSCLGLISFCRCGGWPSQTLILPEAKKNGKRERCFAHLD